MHRKTRWLVAGVAAAALTGVVGVAAARSSHYHTMTVALPDGAVAEIRYAGDVVPRVEVSPDPVTMAAWAPRAFAAWDDPFAALDRIAALMDRQAALVLQQADALEAGARTGPGPGVSYAAEGASGVCGRSVEITSDGSGKAPKVVSRTWGDCAPGAVPVQPGAVKAAPAAGGGDLIRTRAEPAAPANGRAPV